MKRIILILSFFVILAQSFSQRTQLVDSLTNRLSTDEDTTRVNTLNSLVLALRMNNPEKSFVYLKESKELAYKLNFKKGIGDALHLAGILYSNKGDYEIALENYFASLKIRKEINDINGIGASSNNIGLVLWNQGKLEEALTYYLTSLKIDEEDGEKEGMATSYNNIGIIYWTLGSYDKALEYFSKTLSVYELLGHKEGMAGVYSNIGGIYFNKKDSEKALEYFLGSIKLYAEINDKRGIALAYGNISEVYSEKNEFPKSLEYQQKALKIQEDIGDKLHLAYSFSGIGKTYLKMNKISAAIAYLNRGEEMAIELGVPQLRSDVYKMLAEAHKAKGDFEIAISYQEKYSDLRDSVINEDANKQVAEMEAKFQNELKENKIKLLNKENILKSVEIKQKQIVIYGITVSLTLFIILSFLIYWNFSQKKKLNLQLTEKNKIIEQKNVDITDSIEYAKTLQDAIFPDPGLLAKSFPHSFVFFRPRDIVSGDFYWILPVLPANQSNQGTITQTESNSLIPALKENENVTAIFIAAADCTGHGVPGAFVSMVCINILNQVVVQNGATDPGKILSQVNKGVLEVFRKKGTRSKANDGMDISLIKCTLAEGTWKLEFGGAMNPALVIRNGEVFELAANKRSIGGFTPIDYQFNTQRIDLRPNDNVFLFSDGFHDQFGGERGKKYMFRKLKETLIKISGLSPEKQTETLDRTLSGWQGDLERVDDVLIIGFKV